ncbi:MAG TPA: amino acid ABC transporter ATP-binding protein [Pyrinomonadaceae bacterium]|nr:amino acid ABC transporter ATP-binding protein [Pyrinomonadaceae bacterium]
MIRVENLEKSYGDVRVLKGLTFAVEPRTVLGVIGGSGSGKSTLLRCLNGLERIDGGAVEAGGVRLEASLGASEYARRVKQLRRHVGMVFQHLYLFPHLTALGNVTEAPVHVARVRPAEAQARALELLGAVGLREKADRFPDALSGGEQQRVAIARALAMKPEVLLFDEPTSALDPRRTSELRATLRGFVRDGHTMVVVTHSMSFVDGLADSLLYMEAGETVEYGEAEKVLKDPRDPRTREFLSHAR